MYEYVLKGCIHGFKSGRARQGECGRCALAPSRQGVFLTLTAISGVFQYPPEKVVGPWPLNTPLMYFLFIPGSLGKELKLPDENALICLDYIKANLISICHQISGKKQRNPFVSALLHWSHACKLTEKSFWNQVHNCCDILLCIETLRLNVYTHVLTGNQISLSSSMMLCKNTLTLQEIIKKLFKK